jgi:hypothetical protein
LPARIAEVKTFCLTRQQLARTWRFAVPNHNYQRRLRGVSFFAGHRRSSNYRHTA